MSSGSRECDPNPRKILDRKLGLVPNPDYVPTAAEVLALAEGCSQAWQQAAGARKNNPVFKSRALLMQILEMVLLELEMDCVRIGMQDVCGGSLVFELTDKRGEVLRRTLKW